MTIRIFACLLSVFVVGCGSSRTGGDSFASLRDRVAESLSGRCDVTRVRPDESLGCWFEVHEHNSGCRILILQREFLTQKEWDRRCIAGINLLAEFMTLVKTNHQMDIETAKRFAGMDGFLRLPKWSYDGIGVDADTQCPEVVYPEMARDSASAQRILQEIVGFLKPYGGANKALHTTAAAPGF